MVGQTSLHHLSPDELLTPHAAIGRTPVGVTRRLREASEAQGASAGAWRQVLGLPAQKLVFSHATRIMANIPHSPATQTPATRTLWATHRHGSR